MFASRSSRRSSPAQINNDLRRFVQVEAGDGRLRSKSLPDVHLLFSEFLMVLIDGDLRVEGSARRLQVSPEHSVALVVAERKTVHLVEPQPRTRRGVLVDPG